MKFIDDWGDEHEVEARIDIRDGARFVFLDSDPFTPAEARRLAAALVEAADLSEQGIAVIPGGAEVTT